MTTRGFGLLSLASGIGLAAVLSSCVSRPYATANGPNWENPGFTSASGPVPDFSAEHKKFKEEFAKAEVAAQKKQVSVESFQSTLDKLRSQEHLYQQEIAGDKAKIAAANEKLDNYNTSLGSTEEFTRWHGQKGIWEARLQEAEADLAKVQADYSATLQAMNTTLQQESEDSPIMPGNSLEVTVYQDPTLTGVYGVYRGGYINMPRLGRINVAGKSCPDTEKAIRDAVERAGIFTGADVTVERKEGFGGENPVIYCQGEFIHPGAFDVPRGFQPTVVTTIIRAGVKDTADLTRVTVQRLVNGQPQIEELNVEAIFLGLAGLQSDLSLNPGDIINVPAAANEILVSGNVLKPGVLKLLPQDQITALSAIIRCGGFARFADKRNVYVSRDLGNGARKKIPVDIKAIQAGRGADLVLQPKDIVFVPEKFFSF